MTLFGFGKNKKEGKPQAEKKAERVAPVRDDERSTVALAKHVLIRPRVTEKAASMTSSNVYTFDITRDATKRDVLVAVKVLYKVTPLKVNVVNVKAKRVRMRRKRGFGTTAASRKAYVFLKKGDSITLT